MNKICAVCNKEKNYDQFYTRNQGANRNRQSYCKDCSKRRHREDIAKMKLEVFAAYGGSVCACCGYVGHADFLAIDHINNGGSHERKRLGMTGGYRFYCFLKRNNWPTGYQVLCHNCNFAKGMNGGICPHKFILPDHLMARCDPLKVVT